MFGVNSLKKWLILCYFHKKRSSFWVFVPKNVYYERVSFPFVTWFCLFYTLMYGSTGPIGPVGPTGPSGSIPVSSTEELFFTSYEDTNKSNEMLFKDSWLIPNHSISFTLVSDSEVEVQPGIYEIAFSGLIEKADGTHGAGFYLQDKDGAAIKDFSYELPIGSGNQLQNWQTNLMFLEEEFIIG